MRMVSPVLKPIYHQIEVVLCNGSPHLPRRSRGVRAGSVRPRVSRPRRPAGERRFAGMSQPLSLRQSMPRARALKRNARYRSRGASSSEYAARTTFTRDLPLPDWLVSRAPPSRLERGRGLLPAPEGRMHLPAEHVVPLRGARGTGETS